MREQFDEASRKFSKAKEQMSGGYDNSPTLQEEMAKTTRPLTEEEAKKSAEDEYKKWEEREKRRIETEEEREKNKVKCKTCGQKKDARDISIVFERGSAICRTCATSAGTVAPKEEKL